MNSVAVLIIFVLMLVVAIGFGVFFGLRRNVAQVCVRIGMVLASAIVSVVLTVNLSPVMFIELISLLESFLGAESLTYLLSGTEGANGILSFVQAMVAPVSFALFFLCFTFIFTLIYKVVCYFFISDERIAARKKKKEGEEENLSERSDNAEEQPAEEEPAPYAEKISDEKDKEVVENSSVASTAPQETGGWNYYEEGGSDNAAAVSSVDVEVSEPEENIEAEEIINEKENEAEDKEGKRDKKEKNERKPLSPKVKRGILVGVNTLCALITAVSLSVPITSFIGAFASLIDGVGGEEAAKEYIDTVNTDGDTTGAKEFISEVTLSSNTPFYYIYSALGTPITYAITEVSVGDTAAQPLNKAIASSGELMTPVLELIANADLLSAKTTWVEYAEVLYASSDTIAETPYWDSLLGSIFADASEKWKDDRDFIGIESPFKFGYDSLEKDIYIILSKNNKASVELNALGDALCAFSAVACASDSTFDTASAVETLLNHITDESAAIVKSYITDELIVDMGLTEKATEVYKTIVNALVDGAVEVGETKYESDEARSKAIAQEAEYVENFLKFFYDPTSVSNDDFIDSCLNSAIVKNMLKNLTGSGEVNDPAGIASLLSYERLNAIKDIIFKWVITSSAEIDYEEYLYIIAYLTGK